MPERFTSPTLRKANEQLMAIPIGRTILGHKLGFARSTLEIVDSRLATGQVAINDACFALFLGYFAYQADYGLDPTRSFAQALAAAGPEFASEHNYTEETYWPIRAQAEKCADDSSALLLLDGMGYIDTRHQAPSAWPNPRVATT